MSRYKEKRSRKFRKTQGSGGIGGTEENWGNEDDSSPEELFCLCKGWLESLSCTFHWLHLSNFHIAAKQRDSRDTFMRLQVLSD